MLYSERSIKFAEIWFDQKWSFVGQEVNIAYSIMSVNNSRKDKKESLRSIINYPELINKIKYYDAREDDDLLAAVKRFSDVKWEWQKMRRGHFGVWASTISAWEYIAKSSYDGVLVFEDDAIVHKDFHFLMEKYLPQLPDGWDLFTIHSPHNQDGDFHWDYKFNERGEYGSGAIRYDKGAPCFDIEQPDLCRAYMGYGAVALMYSPKGAQKFLDYIYSEGVWSSSDCQIYQMSKFSGKDKVNGYCIKPQKTKPATTSLDSETQIHNTEEFDLGKMIEEARGE